MFRSYTGMAELELFKEFIKGFLKTIGLNEEAESFELADEDSDYTTCANILQKLNTFFYVTDTSIGENSDHQRYFISRFHKFWRRYHKEVIQPEIDEAKCSQVAEVLEAIHAAYPSRLNSAQTALLTSGTNISLTPHQLANVRFFTVTQDFKIRFRINPYSLAVTEPRLFSAREILDHYPTITDELLHELGAETQTDKRHKFSRLSAELLIEAYEGDAFNICQRHNNDVLGIRKALVDNPNTKYQGKLGFSDKKANLFIRDLVAMGVWNVRNPEEIDVSSDANTMRIALRTALLKVRWPLLTSYVDVYDYQYGLIDEYTKQTWRKVWEVWGTLSSNHRVVAPAMFDFLIYRIGQNCCKPKTRRCDTQCNSNRLAKCSLRTETLTSCNGWCVFRGICGPTTRKMHPPRAISMLGGTGWEDGRTDEGGGKGISS